MVMVNLVDEFLTETEGFPPLGEGLEFMRGKTLTKAFGWLKAILLVKDSGDKLQLRLYGWQWSEQDNEYKVRQKFSISRGFANELAEIFHAFSLD